MRSIILVIIQFTSIACIVALGTFPSSFPALMLLFTGLLLGAVSISIMNFDNLRIRPEPKENVRFITAGPYRIIRHPMYTSVMLLSLAFMIEDPTFMLGILFLILLFVLWQKILIEEKMLSAIFPEYTEYQKKTYRLIPFIF